MITARIKTKYLPWAWLPIATSEIWRACDYCARNRRTVHVRYRFSVGRATNQVVSRWLRTAATRVRGQVMWDLWWTKWHWRFSPNTTASPAWFSFHQLLHIHHLSSGAGTIGQLLADVPNLTQPQETILKNWSTVLVCYVPSKRRST
jgi:hypothetical protein